MDTVCSKCKLYFCNCNNPPAIIKRVCAKCRNWNCSCRTYSSSSTPVRYNYNVQPLNIDWQQHMKNTKAITDNMPKYDCTIL